MNENVKVHRTFTVEDIDTGARETFYDIEELRQRKTLNSTGIVGAGPIDTVNADGVYVDVLNDGTFKIPKLGKRYREVSD